LIVKGHLGYESFTEAVLHDPTVAALRHRVHLTEDPQMSAALPRLKPARVTLTLKDGRASTHRYDDDRRAGAPTNESAIREKFRELAGLVLTQGGVAGVEEAIDRCEQWTSVDQLTETVRRSGRAPSS
jgi:2-methylcitrate dehydratase PrpD